MCRIGVWAHFYLILKDQLITTTRRTWGHPELHLSPCSTLLTLLQTFQFTPGLCLHLSHSHLTQTFWPWLHFLASEFLSPSQLISWEVVSWVTISLAQSAPGNTPSVFYSTLTSYSVYPRSMCKNWEEVGISVHAPSGQGALVRVQRFKTYSSRFKTERGLLRSIRWYIRIMGRLSL